MFFQRIILFSFFIFVFTSPLMGAEIPDMFIHDTIAGPVVDGISLAVPSELGNQTLARDGLVDVSAAPFFADPTGSKDATAAIQKAINFARDHQLVCFFPSGNYRISDTIECVQNFYRRSNGRIDSARNFPCMLVGSQKGNRPALFLAPRSRGFQNPKKGKYVIHFWARDFEKINQEQPNISFNQIFANIDVKVGAENGGAIAIRHRGAQGSGVQDCTIDVTNGLTGLEGGCGSGGSHANLTIIGGEIGLDLRDTQPVPTISGITLLGQNKHAIIYGGRQSLSAVGVRIVSSGIGPVIFGSAEGSAFRGHISLVDSEIEFTGKGGEAIRSDQNIYLRNVFLKNSKSAVQESDQPLLPGAINDWLWIEEFAHSTTKRFSDQQVRAPIYLDNQKSYQDYRQTTLGKKPDDDLVARHSWPKNISRREMDSAVNVTASPYSAKGDGLTDDTAAIQQAIDENDVVFLPKGYYKVSRSLRLHPFSKLSGVAGHLSVIMTRPMAASVFMDQANPKPLMRTADTSEAETIVANLGLFAPKEVPGCFTLDWQSGGQSVVKNVNFLSLPPLRGFKQPGNLPPREFPLVLVANHGGGKWWNFFQEDYFKEGKDYRHLLIKGISGPLNIYQCNPESARGDANLEVADSREINIFGLKGEGNKPILSIHGTNGINVYGYGGNASPPPGKAIFVVDGSSRFRLVNLIESPRKAGSGSENDPAGVAYPPEVWHMVGGLAAETPAPAITLPMERPVLVKRGQP